MKDIWQQETRGLAGNSSHHVSDYIITCYYIITAYIYH